MHESSGIPAGFVALPKVEGGEADRHELRAESLQRLAYLLAMGEARQELGERLKPSRVEPSDATALRPALRYPWIGEICVALGCIVFRYRFSVVSHAQRLVKAPPEKMEKPGCLGVNSVRFVLEICDKSAILAALSL